MDNRTAVKLFVRDVTDRSLNKEEGQLSYIDFEGSLVSTVRLMGVVVSKYETDRFTIITLDDATETISVRVFGEDIDLLTDVKVGQTFDVIGTLRDYEEETYIAPRIVKMIEDPNWEVVRSLELLIQAKRLGADVAHETLIDEEEESTDLKPLVMEAIEKIDEGDGADYNSILRDSGLEDAQLDETLNSLLGDSEIYEPKIGKFKKI